MMRILAEYFCYIAMKKSFYELKFLQYFYWWVIVGWILEFFSDVKEDVAFYFIMLHFQ